MQTRSERYKSTNPEDFAAITGREVNWRHTPIGLLEELLSGELVGEGYEIDANTPELRWMWREDLELGQAGLPEDKASALAWKNTQRVLHIDLQTSCEEPLVLTRNHLLDIPRAAHTLIQVRRGVSAELMIANSGAANLLENVEIVLEEDAQLSFVTCQDWESEALQAAAHFARLGKNSSLRHFTVSLGGDLVRLNPSFHLAEEGAQVEALGIYFAHSYQHMEHQVYVNHAAPDTKSEINYRGVLSGTRSRGVWIGDVLIGSRAKNSDSYEQNRNLILSSEARADSIPNLEIENGDILGAGHASATTRFDDEHLFYLQSRGINQKEALRMVVNGFLLDVLQKSNLSQTLQEYLSEKLTSKLERAQEDFGGES